MTLIDLEGVWINPVYVVRVWWVPPSYQDRESDRGYTLVRFTDGSILQVDMTVAEVVGQINGGTP